MPATIEAACPECQQSVKANADLLGKKVRCKGCGHVYALATAGLKAGPASKSGRNPLEDTPADRGYGLLEEDTEGLRCPNCAQELAGEHIVLCVNCGYNMRTRQRVGTKKMVEQTVGDRLGWLLAGYLALAGVFALIAFDLFYWYGLPRLLGNSDWNWLANLGVKIWVVVLSAFAGVGLARFAFRRLVLQPHPPERDRG